MTEGGPQNASGQQQTQNVNEQQQTQNASEQQAQNVNEQQQLHCVSEQHSSHQQQQQLHRLQQQGGQQQQPVGTSLLSALSAAAISQAPHTAVNAQHTAVNEVNAPQAQSVINVPAEAGAEVKEAFTKLRLQVGVFVCVCVYV